MTWLPHPSHPDYWEVMESTGALAENDYLRAAREGRILDCSLCWLQETKSYDCHSDGMECPNLIRERRFEDYCLYCDFSDFMELPIVEEVNKC